MSPSPIRTRRTAPLAGTGIGLRAPHLRAACSQRPPVGFFEIHSENWFVPSESATATLESLRTDYDLSLHGVGLSLGSTDLLSREHLQRLCDLCRRWQPALISEHLSWTSVGGRHLHELLPLPYTAEALAVVAENIARTQDALGRPLLVENLSAYLAYCDTEMSEPEFLAELVRRSGCGLLLDVNNLQVSAHNLGFDPLVYLAALPAAAVGEIHLAGHTRVEVEGGTLSIDTHDRRVAPEVWALYRAALARFGARPSLIEWDADLPTLAVLVEEAATANDIGDEVLYARAA